MKKIILFLLLISLFVNGRTNQPSVNDQQKIVINQLRGSAVSAIAILKEIEKARMNYGQDSIVRKEAEEKLVEKKLRSNFVIWYYNYSTMIENDPYLPKKEKESSKELVFEEANRIYKEKYRHKNWATQAGRSKIGKEFLEFHLITDRFLNLILRIYEKYDEDIKATEEFINLALADPNPMDYILRDLRENIQIASVKQRKIQKGETLSELFGKKWKKIAEYNGIKDPTKLKPGQIILIPEQTITIPKNVDQITQLCLLAADQLVSDPQEKIIVAENTLAILRVETREGRLIGTATYHKAMNPSEKIEFLKLCQRLSIDPETSLVSNKPSYGWGGAMGPAQFLPSTWTAYEPNVSALVGKKFVSPYNLKDAAFAAASKLVSGGVASGGNIAEKRATMLYFAGKNWDESEYQFYWNKVKNELTKIRKNQEIEKLIIQEEKGKEKEIK